MRKDQGLEPEHWENSNPGIPKCCILGFSTWEGLDEQGVLSEKRFNF